MSIVALAPSCCCGSIGAPVTDVRFCSDHHAYYRGDKRLDSVTAILKACWPVKPDYDKIPPETLENARLRGIDVDEMFSAWVSGKTTRFPAGSRREDSKALFLKLTTWWNRAYGSLAKAQTILADQDVAGTCDVIAPDRMIYDLKTTFNASEPIYELQLGMYANLYETQFGEPPQGIAIIHVTERFDTPKIIHLDLKQCRHDAQQVKDVWLIAKRRLRK